MSQKEETFVVLASGETPKEAASILILEAMGEMGLSDADIIEVLSFHLEGLRILYAESGSQDSFESFVEHGKRLAKERVQQIHAKRAVRN